MYKSNPRRIKIRASLFLMMKNPAGNGPSAPLLFLFITCIVAFACACFFEYSNNPFENLFKKVRETRKMKTKSNQAEFPLICTAGNTTVKTCPASYYPAKFPAGQRENLSRNQNRNPVCPEYFRWIHEDLMPWRKTGISLEMVQAAAKTKKPHFRLVIVNGTAYVHTYKKSFQTRDVITQWGILQLLRRYPGKIPDLDLVFNCEDRPQVAKESYPTTDAAAPPPPPLFGYDGDDASFDLAFPDWSFWGWAELNIKPWEKLVKELKEGNEVRRWTEREPYAYWKGTARLAPWRMDLLRCNVSDNQDWNARIYEQNWLKEVKQGFENSNLASQCIDRYKIYIEGKGWSVSEKYILACNSVTLMVKPRYYDFFSRGLIPLKHFWPINPGDKCRAIKHAVHWGNTHQEEAQGIGNAASDFIQNELQMKNVYDYMFHLLNEYAKLLTYKPSIPSRAVELCSEGLACSAQGLNMKVYMSETLVLGPSDEDPCTLQPPYDAASLHSVLNTNANSIRIVETYEKLYFNSLNKSK